MSILRKASTETKQIALDDTDFIVVRADISKREFNALAGSMPNMTGEGATLSVGEASAFQRVLFGTLVVGWSLDGSHPTAEDYDALSAESAAAIDAKLIEHFEALLPTSAEGK
jgi:lysophospholipase L1-like esterase